MSDKQEEINTINTDSSVLQNKTLLLHTEPDNNIAIFAALANTCQTTTDTAIQVTTAIAAPIFLPHSPQKPLTLQLLHLLTVNMY